jgi:hypothetical protein
VTTPNFLADDKWAELRHLPLALGFVGACQVFRRHSSGNLWHVFSRAAAIPRRRSAEGWELLASAAALIVAHF